MKMQFRCLVLLLAALALTTACGGEDIDPGAATPAEKSEPGAAPEASPESPAAESATPDSPPGAQAPEAKAGENIARAQAPEATSLAGEWVLESMGSADDPQPALESVKVTAMFAGNGIKGNAGCNSYSAAYESDGQAIKVSQPIATRKYCSTAGVMEQEAAYLTALAEASAYEIEGDRLTITYGEELHLTFRR